MKAFGWTHDQYLDTPQEAIDWLLRIHVEVKTHEAEQMKASTDAARQQMG